MIRIDRAVEKCLAERKRGSIVALRAGKREAAARGQDSGAVPRWRLGAARGSASSLVLPFPHCCSSPKLLCFMACGYVVASQPKGSPG